MKCFIKFGNVLDDLKAMQKDVKVYEKFDFISAVKQNNPYGLTVEIKSDAVWVWSSEGKGIKFDKDTLPALILKLRQMEATLERNQK
jgi:hypothetical protein